MAVNIPKKSTTIHNLFFLSFYRYFLAIYTVCADFLVFSFANHISLLHHTQYTKPNANTNTNTNTNTKKKDKSIKHMKQQHTYQLKTNTLKSKARENTDHNTQLQIKQNE